MPSEGSSHWSPTLPNHMTKREQINTFVSTLALEGVCHPNCKSTATSHKGQ